MWPAGLSYNMAAPVSLILGFGEIRDVSGQGTGARGSVISHGSQKRDPATAGLSPTSR